MTEKSRFRYTDRVKTARESVVESKGRQDSGLRKYA